MFYIRSKLSGAYRIVTLCTYIQSRSPRAAVYNVSSPPVSSARAVYSEWVRASTHVYGVEWPHQRPTTDTRPTLISLLKDLMPIRRRVSYFLASFQAGRISR